jgi:hypothetical protein
MRTAPPSLTELETNWESQFPGDTPLLDALRTQLVFADWHNQHTRLSFLQLHAELIQTGLPMHYWDRFTHRLFLQIQTHAEKLLRTFLLSLRSLQTSYLASQSEPDPTAPPPPRKKTFFQEVRLTRKDGKLISGYNEYDAAWLLKANFWDRFDNFIRRIRIRTEPFPEEYASLLTNKGKTYKPKRNLYIGYSPADFKRICELEVETSAEHFIDIENRVHYEWRDED